MPQDHLAELMLRAGLRGWQARLAAFGMIWLCLALWIRSKTIDQDERGNAERRAIFVGHWAPTLYLIGESLDRQAAASARRATRPRPSLTRRGRRWHRRPFA